MSQTIDKKRLAIFISGRGSNMDALLDACESPDYPALPALILSNRPTAGGLEKAKSRGIATAIVDHKDYASREEFEHALQNVLEKFQIEFIALAGFMRVLTPWFISRWENRLINIHPSLLPSFPGLHTHQRAIAAGCRLAGCSVHYVTAGVDEGPIIGQAAVPIIPGDTPDTLAARVIVVEHKLYPKCLAAAISSNHAQTRIDVHNDAQHSYIISTP